MHKFSMAQKYFTEYMALSAKKLTLFEMAPQSRQFLATKHRKDWR